MHGGLGLPEGVEVLETFEDWLGELHGITVRMRGAEAEKSTFRTGLLGKEGAEGWLVLLLEGATRWLSGASGNVTVGALEAGVAARADIRAHPRFRDGDLLVGGA